MFIYLMNKNLEVVKCLSSKGDIFGISPFFNDRYVQYLETGAETFEFEMCESQDIELSTYVAFEYKAEYKLFQIVKIEDSHEDYSNKKIYCEICGLELINEPLRPRSIPSANIEQLLTNILSDTDWKVGYVDGNIQDVHTVDIEKYDKIYPFLQDMIKKYDCEIAFRITIINNKVKKYIDAFKRRGSKTHHRFEYSENVSGISRVKDSFNLATSLIGVGKDNLTFKTVEWSKEKGDPCDKPLNQDFVVDEEAYARWNQGGNHIMDIFECDSESAHELLILTWNELQKRKIPELEYTVSSNLLDDVRIGDEVYIIDNDGFNPPLHLSARASELHISFTNEEDNEIVFCNYKKVKSLIEKEDVDTLFPEITVGANNYILNSGNFKNTKYWSNNVVVENGILSGGGQIINSTPVKIQSNTEYVFSAEIMLPKDFVMNETNLLKYLSIDTRVTNVEDTITKPICLTFENGSILTFKDGSILTFEGKEIS